jgi:hypothetical protein
MVNLKLLLLVGIFIGSVGVGALARGFTARSEAVARSTPDVPGLCSLRFGNGDSEGLTGVDIVAPTAELAAAMPFASVVDAVRFVRENQARLTSAAWALAPHLSVRFQAFRRCLGYDKQPHPLTRLHVRWHLAATGTRLTASRFALARVEGQAGAPLTPCFDRTFAAPVQLEGVPEPAAALRYRGGAPSLIVYDL